jgi:ectoine hydroxylase-related dioxygenase (phytanoyl-CoA dioxygenase family)
LAGTKYEERIVSCLGPAGSVVIFNNQVWHRGAPNTSDRVRAMTQVSYARRIIGHRYYPFMNYQMPEHVYKDAAQAAAGVSAARAVWINREGAVMLVVWCH